MAPPDGVAMNVRMRFNQSMRGLTVGAPVDFRGVVLGNVTATALDYDRSAGKLFAVVDARIYPERLGELFERQIRSEEHTSELQSLMRISYAVFCLKKNKQDKQKPH